MSYYENSGTGVLKFARSTDDCVTWTTKTIDSSYVGEYSSIAVLNNNIYISYYDTSGLPSYPRIKLAKSSDRGESWVFTGVPTDSSVYNGGITKLVIHDNKIYICFSYM